ncbi:10383_t:CDS:2, partial [Paraglomus brasilianum]
WGSTKVQLIIPNREVAEQWRRWIIEIIGVARLAKSGSHNEMKKSAKDGLNQIVDKNYRSNTASHIQMIVEVAMPSTKKHLRLCSTSTT